MTGVKLVVGEPYVEDLIDDEERPCGEDLDCYNQLIIMKTSKSVSYTHLTLPTKRIV